MSAKHFFIAHGEKVAISLTLLLVAAQCYVTFSDTSIRPANINPAEIETKNIAIDAVFAQGKPPVLKPVPGYLAEMEARFNKPIPPSSAISWLTAAPDRGPGSGGLLLYVLEVPAPEVTATDTVGSAELTVSLPPVTRPADKRLSDGAVAAWQRTAEGISNHAEHLGVLIETHRGDNQWRPLSAKALNKGFITIAKLKELGGRFPAENLEPWIRHSFRARVVVKATGLDFEQAIPAKVAASVVVIPGRMVPDGDDIPWSEFTEKVRAKDIKTLTKLAKPMKDAVPGITLAADEKLYAGADSEVAAVQVTSNIRFALDKVSADLVDPAKEVASFLVTRQYSMPGKDRDTTKLWLKTPQVFKPGIGDSVGGMALTETPINPDKKQNVDLTTPFKVVDIKRQQKRVLYWEIGTDARPGSKGKDLKLVEKSTLVDVVVVENSKSHNRMDLSKLIVVKRPARKDAITFPLLRSDVDEEAEFRRSPAEFIQAAIIPAEPKRHAADEGPLGKVREDHPDAADLYTTDTAYYEFADGRVVWWEPLNKAVREFPEPSAEDLKTKPQSPDPRRPAGTVPPGGRPPGTTPPGARPPGAMPPGMLPGMLPSDMPPGVVPKPAK